MNLERRQLVWSTAHNATIAWCALVVLAAACGGTSDTVGTSTTADPGEAITVAPNETGSTNDTTTTEEPSGDAKIRGSAVNLDDVGSVSPSPMRNGTLAIMAAADAPQLWDVIEFTPPDSELPYVSGLIEGADIGFAELVSISAGRFALNAPDGDYLVCLLDGTGPYALSGCAVMTIFGPAEWSISRGEGGFEVGAAG